MHSQQRVLSSGTIMQIHGPMAVCATTITHPWYGMHRQGLVRCAVALSCIDKWHEHVLCSITVMQRRAQQWHHHNTPLAMHSLGHCPTQANSVCIHA